MRDKGMGSWPTRRARMSPDLAAFVQDGVETTFAQVEDRSTAIAWGLRGLGVRRGDRVAFLGLNSVDFLVTMFGAAKLGAVTLPLNTRLTATETAYILTDSEPSVLVWDAGFEGIVSHPAIASLPITQVAVVPQPAGEVPPPTTPTPTLPELEDAGRRAAGASGAEPLDEPIELDELFMIQYTSGTSGRPKGVMLTHGNITWNVYNALIDLDLTSTERTLVTAPLFHTVALNQVLLPTFIKGGVCYLEAKFDPDRFLELVQSQGITFVSAVTSVYQAVMHSPLWDGANLDSLRNVMSGGSPLPMSLLEAYADRGHPIAQGYGLTESSPGASLLRAVDGVRKIGSAGTSCFFSDLRVVPVQDLAEAGGSAEAGEVEVSGPNVTPGYWRNPEATATAFTPDGFLKTGDLGRCDSGGYLYIVDRLKDMIISGGENIYPAEVEATIYTHPAVAEVAVIGVPDERWGEVGRAVVTVKPGHQLSEDELLAHLDGRLARYKMPKSVVIINELPHTASGKLVKGRVRELWGGPLRAARD